MPQRVVVRQDGRASEEVPTEIIAKSIVTISEGVKAMRAGRLNNRALVLLIQAACPGNISQKDVRTVLDAMEALEATYIRRPT